MGNPLHKRTTTSCSRLRWFDEHFLFQAAALVEEIDQDTRLLLVQVRPDSPAEQGGLFLGDTLIALNDQPVPHHDALTALLGGDRVGSEVTVRIIRAGAVQELDVVVGERG